MCVPIMPHVKCQQDEIDLRYYSIIYEMIDDVKAAMSGLLTPERRENILGVAQVREVFRSSRFGAAAGCMVLEGIVYRNKPIRVLRDEVVVFQGELESLRRFKDDLQEVRHGMECGMAVKGYNDIRTGDKIEVYEVHHIKACCCWTSRRAFLQSGADAGSSPVSGRQGRVIPGSLDPLATGLLPVCLGEASNLRSTCSMPTRSTLPVFVWASPPPQVMPKER
jgi:hypothetical protein